MPNLFCFSKVSATRFNTLVSTVLGKVFENGRIALLTLGLDIEDVNKIERTRKYYYIEDNQFSHLIKLLDKCKTLRTLVNDECINERDAIIKLFSSLRNKKEILATKSSYSQLKYEESFSTICGLLAELKLAFEENNDAEIHELQVLYSCDDKNKFMKIMKDATFALGRIHI